MLSFQKKIILGRQLSFRSFCRSVKNDSKIYSQRIILYLFQKMNTRNTVIAFLSFYIFSGHTGGDKNVHRFAKKDKYPFTKKLSYLFLCLSLCVITPLNKLKLSESVFKSIPFINILDKFTFVALYDCSFHI